MSVQAMGWALAQKTGSPTRKAVLNALAQRHNNDTGQCNPRIALIAEDTELSVAGVKKAIVQLEKAGYLHREGRKRDNGSDSTNQYVLHMGSPRNGEGSQDGPPGVTTWRGEGSPGDPLEPEVLEPELQPEVKETRAVAREAAYDPLKGRRVDGRDLPWDALAALTEATGSANGPRMKRALASIREEVVAEIRSRVPDGHTVVIEHNGTVHDPVDEFIERGGGWKDFEDALAAEITKRGQALIRANPGLTWGPEGIARNWRKAGHSTANRVEEILSREAS